MKAIINYTGMSLKC